MADQTIHRETPKACIVALYGKKGAICERCWRFALKPLSSWYMSTIDCTKGVCSIFSFSSAAESGCHSSSNHSLRNDGLLSSCHLHGHT